MSLDSHLQFLRPTHKDKNLLTQLNSSFQPYADTAYGTLNTWWNLYNDLELAHFKGNVVVRSSYPSDGKNLVYSLIGGYAPDETVAGIFAFLKHMKQDEKLEFVPAYIVDALQDRSPYVITINPDIAEYVLSTEQHSELSGNDFLKVRHKVSAFVNKYGEPVVRELNLDSDRQLILDSLEAWQPLTNNDQTKQEQLIIEQSLKVHKDIEMHGIGTFIEDELVGLILYKILPQGYANINHVKVNYQFMDIFVHSIHSTAKYLRDHGVEYLNIEQDLGIEGLRTFKQRLRPVKMLEKYTIVPR